MKDAIKYALAMLGVMSTTVLLLLILGFHYFGYGLYPKPSKPSEAECVIRYMGEDRNGDSVFLKFQVTTDSKEPIRLTVIPQEPAP